MAQNNTKKYIDVLPAIVKAINHRYLDSIGTSPDQVTIENSGEIFRRRYEKILSAERPKRPLRYAVGDHVRIPIKRKTFDKSYTKNYMDEIFTIVKIVYRPPVYVYKLVGPQGNPLDKSYYAEEIVRAFIS